MNKIITIICMTFIIVACQNNRQSQESYFSASACAKNSRNGEIVECKIDKSVSDRQFKFLEFSIELDKLHPSPKKPDANNLGKSKLYKVEQVDENNTIYLANGTKLSLAGLKCKDDPNFHKYLTAFLLGQHAYKVSYELTGLKVDGIQYAYIWEVGIDLGSVSSINETAITSQWCTPIIQQGHQYHTRYKLLSDYIKNNPRDSRSR